MVETPHSDRRLIALVEGRIGDDLNGEWSPERSYEYACALLFVIVEGLA